MKGQMNLKNYFSQSLQKEGNKNDQQIKQNQSEIKQNQSELKKIQKFDESMEIQEEQKKRLRKVKICSSDEDNIEKVEKRCDQFEIMKKEGKKIVVKNNEIIKKEEKNNVVRSSNNETPKFKEEENGKEEYNEFSDRTPKWAVGEGIRDKNGKRQWDEGYDPSSLMIEEKYFKELTPTMRQYWKIKQNNFDKIIFFKLGKFYEIFYEDAVICNKYLDLNWMARKMHVGFPEKGLEKYASMLVQMGFKVAIVEQMETPQQMNERIKHSSNKDKTVSREVVEILTKGTHNPYQNYHNNHLNNTNTNTNNHNNNNNDQLSALIMDNKYLMSIRQQDYNIALVLLECSTDQLTLVYLQNDKYLEQFKTVVQQFRPLEVLINSQNVSKDMWHILKNSNWHAVISQQGNEDLEWHYGVGVQILKEEWKQDCEQQRIVSKYEQNKCMMESVSGLMSYLKGIMLLEKIVSLGVLMEYDYNNTSEFMMLDSQSIQHLELLDSELKTDKEPYKGSVYQFINRSSTPMGSRLIKRWLLAPLYNLIKINTRLDSVTFLNLHQISRDSFRHSMRNSMDLERLTSMMYQLTIKNKGAVYFEDQTSKNIRLFHQLITQYLFVHQKLMQLKQDLEPITDLRINQLLTQLLPDIPSHIAHFQSSIQVINQNQDKKVLYIPVIKDHKVQEQIINVQQQLEEYLQQQRIFFKNSNIQYVSIKYKYELEIPEALVLKDKKPKDFELTSQKQGYQRFQTSFIKIKIEELEELEEKKEKEGKEFMNEVFGQFYMKYKIWNQFISVISEMDCLCGLSVVGFENSQMVRAQVVESVGEMKITGMVHCVLKGMKKLIENSLELENGKRTVIITGPNMGGKSTLLRTISVVIILAQMGCYVPAQYARFSLVDRIFTRLGASDRLMEGKSTFYIEMEETLAFINQATPHSLAIIDELGRGTSTFDGISIAHSCLQYILTTLHSICFFSTHYHTILHHFQHHTNVIFKTMAYSFYNSTLIHLYKLIDGQTTSSFGIDVARIAGIKESILEKSMIISQQFQKRINIYEENEKVRNIIRELQ